MRSTSQKEHLEMQLKYFEYVPPTDGMSLKVSLSFLYALSDFLLLLIKYYNMVEVRQSVVICHSVL